MKKCLFYLITNYSIKKIKKRDFIITEINDKNNKTKNAYS